MTESSLKGKLLSRDSAHSENNGRAQPLSSLGTVGGPALNMVAMGAL